MNDSKCDRCGRNIPNHELRKVTPDAVLCIQCGYDDNPITRMSRSHWRIRVEALVSEAEFNMLYDKVRNSETVWEIIYNLYHAGYQDGYHQAWREEYGMD